jgi:hypothetical protein
MRFVLQPAPIAVNPDAFVSGNDIFVDGSVTAALTAVDRRADPRARTRGRVAMIIALLLSARTEVDMFLPRAVL